MAQKFMMGVFVLLAGGVFAGACGGDRSDDDGSAQPGGTGGQGGSEAQGSKGGAGGSTGAGRGGSGGKGGSTNGSGGGSASGDGGEGACGVCGGCQPAFLTVHCSFGRADLEGIEAPQACAAAEDVFLGAGGQGGESNGGGGESGIGGEGGTGGTAVQTGYCDTYVVPGGEDFGCSEGCRAYAEWTKEGTCTIRGECCVVVVEHYCGL
jgi:hypothetical protein